MNVCKKCNNTNMVLNGVWKQCASCGEVYEKQSVIIGTHTIPVDKDHSVADIALAPLNSSFMGKLISRLHLSR